MRLSRKTKKLIKVEQEKLILEMSKPSITPTEWEEANKKYRAYAEMLKPTWKFTPDAVLGALASVGSIFLILNFEKMDIVRSKAMGIVPKIKL